jgi:hypothetical protein
LPAPGPDETMILQMCRYPSSRLAKLPPIIILEGISR